MSQAVGIEISEAGVKILVLEQAGKKTKILQFRDSPLLSDPEKPWEERAAQTIREVCSAWKIPRRNVHVSIDSGEAILREVSLPFKTEDQLRKTVRYEMESQIHNYTIEQLIVSYFKTGETEKGSLVLAAAVPKVVVEKRLKVFQDAGADPSTLDLDVCAVFNAMKYVGAIDTDQPHLLIYGTPRFTKLIFIEQRVPRSIRTIRFSFPGEASPFGALDSDTQGGLVEILAKEISRFLLASAASADPAHILLAGAFEDDQATRRLEAAMGIPVKTFNLLQAVEHPFPEARKEHSAKIGVPLGLALKGLGVDALGMDFRQEEFAYTKKFETVKTTAFVTVELILVFLAAIAFHYFVQRKDLRRDLGTALEWHRELHEDASGEKLSEGRPAFRKMKELLERYEGPGARTLPIEVSAREAWRDLFQALQSFHGRCANQTMGGGTLYVEMDNLSIQETTTPNNETLTMTLYGKIRNPEFAGVLKEEIRKVDLFKEADTGQIAPIPGGDLYKFDVKATKKKGS